MFEVVKLLHDASADVNLVDANGKRAVDLISAQRYCLNSRMKILEHLLGGSSNNEVIDQIILEQAEEQLLLTPTVLKFGGEKKEYPVDPSLLDIKNGIYGMF